MAMAVDPLFLPFLQTSYAVTTSYDDALLDWN